ncbi:CLUMA_CG002511, isoform A [Clunio marinus]|uniref:CLUMA_CG002511, isoform A n=1 Tax=Clunio marinus TaxID=568069 RepID=A0A1J1HN83_9DIPT|nr:CLUMA_CG002511, isoform A [Clunio marinus]
MASKINLIFENGDKMPALGFGTWRAPDVEVESALNAALQAGYRHIDCAPVYGNEKVIGKVFKEWIDSGKIKRSELFITTKLPPFGNRASDVEKCLKKSLADLKLDYLDLYLMHVPFAVPYTEGNFAKHDNGDVVLSDTDHSATWKEFERFQSAGLIKHLGVSNFNKTQIQRLIDNSVVKPEVLQVEMHVYLQQKELVAYCKSKNILVTAYSPLGSKGIEKIMPATRKFPDLMDNPVVIKIATRDGKSPAQILLRYLIELGVSAIPKSTNANRLRQNIDLFNFALSQDDKSQLAGLDANIRVCDFAFFQGIEKHPEFPFEQMK